MAEAGGTQAIRVILVEDEGLFRDLLSVSLGRSERFDVVGSFADGESALTAAHGGSRIRCPAHGLLRLAEKARSDKPFVLNLPKVEEAIL